MFLTELAESLARHVVVVYPGRFQPFHQGHAKVFRMLEATFGSANVKIATTPDTAMDKHARGERFTPTALAKARDKNPFTAAQKVELMHAAGITDDHIVLVNEPYKIDAVTQALNLDANTTVLVFAVGAPDRDRMEVDKLYAQFTATGRPAEIPAGKQVGDEKPMKTFPGVKKMQDCVTIAQGHAYVMVVPEQQEVITVAGKTVNANHGTECRNLWNQIRNNPKERKSFLTQLYGRATPELAHIFDQIPVADAKPVPGTAPKKTTTKLPRTAEPAGGLKPEVKRAAKKANTVLQKNKAISDKQALKESEDFDRGLAKAKQNLLDMVQMRIDSIKQMAGDDLAPWQARLAELEKKKLEIILGHKLGA